MSSLALGTLGVVMWSVALSTVSGSGLMVTPCAPGEGRAETQILHPVPFPTSPENHELRFWFSFSAQGKLLAHLSYPAARETSPGLAQITVLTLIPNPWFKYLQRLPLPRVPLPQHPWSPKPHLPTFSCISLSSAITSQCFSPIPSPSHCPFLPLEILSSWQAQHPV